MVISNTDDSLMLHLKLDQVEDDGTLADASAYHHTAHLKDDATIVDDDLFGACLELHSLTQMSSSEKYFFELSGNAREQRFTDAEHETITISAWIHTGDETDNEIGQEFYFAGINDNHPPSAGTSKYAYFLIYKSKKTLDGRWGQLTVKGNLPTRSPTSRKSPVSQEASTRFETALDSWYHVTATLGGSEAHIYVHDITGKLISESSGCGHMPLNGLVELAYISQVTRLEPFLTPGRPDLRTAHLRLHSRELNEDEAKQLVLQDLGGKFRVLPMLLRARKSPMASLEQVPGESTAALHPVHFSLHDGNDHHLLYIDDGTANHQLILELHNRSQRHIEFVQTEDNKASPENHHLELRFRPGTLSKSTIKALTRTDAAQTILSKYHDEWDLHAPPVTTSSKPISIYLLKTGGRRYEDGLMLPMRNMTADGDYGSRPTRVELKLGQMRYVGTEDPILCQRSTSLNIMWGLPLETGKAAPLHVGFPGSHSLLNDGNTPNTLLLRVTNTSDKPIEQPHFELAFDIGDESKWWALDVDNNQITVQAQWPNQSNWVETERAKKGAVSAPRKHIVKPHPGGLAAGQHLDIQISNIITSRSGNTNLYLDYKHITGCRPGLITCTVERSSVVYDQDKRRIDIGTPDAKLEDSRKNWEIRASRLACNTLDVQHIHGSGMIEERQGNMTFSREGVTVNALDVQDHIIANSIRTNSLKIRKGRLQIEAGGLQIEAGTLQIGKDGPKIKKIAKVHDSVDNDQIPTLAWVKKEYGMLTALLGIKEHPVHYPDKSRVSPYAGTPDNDGTMAFSRPLTCYELPGKQFVLIGTFSVQVGSKQLQLGSKPDVAPLVPGIKLLGPITFHTPGGEWAWFPDGTIRPMPGWEIGTSAQIITVEVHAPKRP
ncbi:MAG: hypothetical protein U9Q19_10430 [Pseudomonadota bacterium]|nr:hypothetical protein [Pseudomonadota bacterium]